MARACPWTACCVSRWGWPATAILESRAMKEKRAPMGALDHEPGIAGLVGSEAMAHADHEAIAGGCTVASTGGVGELDRALDLGVVEADVGIGALGEGVVGDDC